jgi:hypothetical protein
MCVASPARRSKPEGRLGGGGGGGGRTRAPEKTLFQIEIPLQVAYYSLINPEPMEAIMASSKIAALAFAPLSALLSSCVTPPPPPIVEIPICEGTEAGIEECRVRVVIPFSYAASGLEIVSYGNPTEASQNLANSSVTISSSGNSIIRALDANDNVISSHNAPLSISNMESGFNNPNALTDWISSLPAGVLSLEIVSHYNISEHPGINTFSVATKYNNNQIGFGSVSWERRDGCLPMGDLPGIHDCL